MTDAPGAPRAGLHVASVQAWRGRFAGAGTGSGDGDATGVGGAHELDAVVIEFGVEDGSVPPLVVPTGSVARLAAVLLDAAESEVRKVSHDPASLGPTGATWDRLRAAPRHLAADVPEISVPKAAGVYAWFCDGVPVHLGRAKSKRGLRARIGGDQLVTESLLAAGSFRARVADHLALERVVGDDGSERLPADELSRLNAWIACCEVAWMTCATADEAVALEAALRAEGEPTFPDA